MENVVLNFQLLVHLILEPALSMGEELSTVNTFPQFHAPKRHLT